MIVEGNALTFLFEFEDGIFEFAEINVGWREHYRDSSCPER